MKVNELTLVPIREPVLKLNATRNKREREEKEEKGERKKKKRKEKAKELVKSFVWGKCGVNNRGVKAGKQQEANTKTF
jgi:hypothetical protein